MIYEQLRTQIEQQKGTLHIHQFGFTSTDKISFSTGVRDLCEMNSCGHYGKSWACPPGVGPYEECRAKILSYDHMFVFTTMHPLEDSYDFEGMMEGKDEHNRISEQVSAYFKELVQTNCLVLAGECCSRCAECTYPDAPCRFPELLTPSIESYGVEVNKLAKTVNVNYINGQNTVTYFGCICY